jgi:hypothetical protein
MLRRCKQITSSDLKQLHLLTVFVNENTLKLIETMKKFSETLNKHMKLERKVESVFQQ